MQRLAVILLCLWGTGWLPAAETLPPRPARYFNDYAAVVPAAKAQQLNEQLAQFERDTSNQIVVAVFARLQTASSLEDYTVRIAKAWQVGQQDKRNGAVLFVFVQDRKMRIEVGYGLEGALPDAICKRIISDAIAPYFRNGDYAGGLAAGVNALLSAARGEYEGSGRTVAERGQVSGTTIAMVIGVLLLLIVLAILALHCAACGSLYTGRGYRRRDTGWDWNWGGSSGGGSWGGGGSSVGSVFSGGGGDFGGGGASGSW